MTVARHSLAGLVSRTRLLPAHAPAGVAGDLLDSLGPEGFAWLYGGRGLTTSGVAARVAVGPGPDRFAVTASRVAELLDAIEVDDPLRLPGTGPLAVGALPFHHGTAGELVVPSRVVGRNSRGLAWVTEIGTPEAVLDDRPPAAEASHHGTVTVTANGRRGSLAVVGGGGRDEWTAAVIAALARIAAGPLAKVVLAREVVVEADEPFDRRAVLDGLRRAHPSSFTYGTADFVGASPELLVRRRGARVVSRPMAGSALRGRTVADDERLVAALASSAKEAEEHALVVEAVRAALAPVCRELVADARPEAVRLATVTHLATTVAGHLATPEPSALALAGLLHPTPAVGGLPRAEALAALAELESFDRGLYAGPVGWVDSRGDGDWAIALRCARLEGARARLAAGAGIVAESDPDAEWSETEAKLEPMLAALAPPGRRRPT